MRSVLVTRPEPGAAATAARLAAMGFKPVVLPLTKIVATPMAPAGPCDAVVATSANALRHAPAACLAALRDKRLYAVGAATAEAARQAGFADIAVAAGTAADLAGLIGNALAPGARLLHLAGRERTAGFAEDLARRGFAVEIAETYRAEERCYDAATVRARLGDAPVWGAPVFSERGGQLLDALAKRDGLGHLFEETRFFCISAKVAAALSGRNTFVAAGPDEDAVLALLSSQG
ncbi:MAG: uroporphyrinogen-III synthase [Aquamicrobium sp.]|uniref:uroporphyrinogen-III synthase n=1 Tax=Aquamicrobium sp. TaxID=1872579 RepID=UPI00349E85BF|nr:uroporphyrinogen-III synthase [Aquamicrobium sp.]